MARHPRIAVGLGAVVVAAAALWAMGRRWWCACGSWSPVSWNVWSEHNSQHLVDPYTFTHVQHGLVFAGVLWLLLRRRSPELRFGLAIVLETAWEIVENTPLIIDRYRETTASLDYYGDSILNALADIAACAVGYLLAERLPGWATVALFVLVEVALALAIRDSLLLNVVMLLFPVEAIRAWQLGAAP